MAIEEEIKLTAASAATLDAVASDPVVLACAEQPARTKPLLATYHDTPTRRLLHPHLAFRLRQEGSVLRANLKGTGGEMIDGLSRRQEWEERLAQPIQHWGELPPGALREQVLALLDPDDILVPLFETAFQRRILVLQLGDARVEMALDQGTIRAGGVVHPLSEVELERLAGPLAPIQSFAAGLAQRHALVPSQHSKFGLGLSLVGIHMDI